jgi:uncharacterized membrane protein
MTDEKLQVIIGNLLRIGVLASAIVVLLAGMVFVGQHHAERASYATFRAESSDLRTINGIFGASWSLRPDAIIQLGLLLLIVTPIVRVALAGVGFYLEGDGIYVAVSLIVLSILLFSVIHAT